ncbi:MAG: hypothetical protein C4617_00370 [Candidatus Liberibacter europaeus]|uniref:Pyrroline-5-carboxylate reductase n=1 Tax=Candidatus Liberibacter europaeus TaxID=744859 RepID=A0A2T4VYP7_9HYPH|nr:hypothetical protein [Candidatus Liberibacter europaeus]PTL86914.1 MAG: hypothetical protein C4617_00370 [Candidatus Liberibacter europaeus]
MSFNSDKIFEKASRLADCASDTIKDISREAEAFAHVKLQNTLNSMGVVHTEEFEAIKCMVSKINDEVSSMQKRIDKIEKNISDLQNILKNDEKSI